MTTVQEYIARIEAKLTAPDENGCLNWTATKTAGYGRININRKPVRVHRFVFEYINGQLAASVFVDHICGNRGCVNPRHLRAVSHQQNNEHRTQLQSNNTSGYPGVYWHSASHRWGAVGKRFGVQQHIGLFPDAWAAYCAWRAWAEANMPFVDDRMLSMEKRDVRPPR